MKQLDETKQLLPLSSDDNHVMQGAFHHSCIWSTACGNWSVDNSGHKSCTLVEVGAQYPLNFGAHGWPAQSALVSGNCLLVPLPAAVTCLQGSADAHLTNCPQLEPSI